MLVNTGGQLCTSFAEMGTVRSLITMNVNIYVLAHTATATKETAQI